MKIDILLLMYMWTYNYRAAYPMSLYKFFSTRCSPLYRKRECFIHVLKWLALSAIYNMVKIVFSLEKKGGSVGENPCQMVPTSCILVILSTWSCSTLCNNSKIPIYRCLIFASFYSLILIIPVLNNACMIICRISFTHAHDILMENGIHLFLIFSYAFDLLKLTHDIDFF